MESLSEEIIRGFESTEPLILSGNDESILVFGSSGGGERFALGVETGNIYLLKNGEVVKKHVGTATKATLAGYIEELL